VQAQNLFVFLTRGMSQVALDVVLPPQLRELLQGQGHWWWLENAEITHHKPSFNEPGGLLSALLRLQSDADFFRLAFALMIDENPPGQLTASAAIPFPHLDAHRRLLLWL
jgi:hypothetical protein